MQATMWKLKKLKSLKIVSERGVKSDFTFLSDPSKKTVLAESE